MDRNEPAPDREHVHHVVKVESGFLKAGSQSAHVFHPTEEALDDVSHGVEVFVMGNRVAAPSHIAVIDSRRRP